MKHIKCQWCGEKDTYDPEDPFCCQMCFTPFDEKHIKDEASRAFMHLEQEVEQLQDNGFSSLAINMALDWVKIEKPV